MLWGIHDGLAQTSWPRQSGPRCDILARPKRQFGPMIRPFGPKNRRFGPNIFYITNPAIDGTQSWLEGLLFNPIDKICQRLDRTFSTRLLVFKVLTIIIRRRDFTFSFNKDGTWVWGSLCYLCSRVFWPKQKRNPSTNSMFGPKLCRENSSRL